MISAMVLAAGRSRRMGTQKLLLPFDGRPLIARVVDELLRSPVEEVLVVIGNEGQPIRDAIAGRRVRFVTNTDSEGEMLSSVRCGLMAVPQQSAAVVVALGDQPGVAAEIVAGLVREFRAVGRGIVVPTHRGQRGHPLLFAMSYRDEILTRHEGRGLRGLLDTHPEDVRELPVSAAGILEDIDVPEDYRRAIDRLSNRRDP
ncbi:MAG: nucleotidyltransferase family protein [Pirellulales bacterium]|nr:nucleotidyltransferase family protein [Pirellulales bacterium]